MTVADTLRSLGRPVAYYPKLAKPLGGTNTAIFFCQIFYWQDKAASALGVHKTTEDLEAETGLTYEEQRAARKRLKAMGVLRETAKRLEHRIYYRIDEAVLETVMTEFANSEKSISPNGKSPGGEVDKVQVASEEKSNPPGGESPVGGAGKVHSVNGTETTTETTFNNPLTPLSPAAPPTSARKLDSSFEQWWALYPAQRRVGKAECEKRWKRKDLGSVAHAIIAHTSAMKLSKQWKDGFEPAPLTYLNQQRWQDPIPPSEAEQAAAVDEAEWFMTTSGVDAQAKRIGFRDRGADEAVPVFRVHVAVASGKGPWISFVLKHAEKSGSEKFYHWVRTQLGDALLPPDDYAS